MLTHACTISKRRSASVIRSLAVCLPLGLSGCSYIETQLDRTAPPDNRIQLDWQERRQLSQRESSHYRCPVHYVLRCDRAGSITLSCTCELR